MGFKAPTAKAADYICVNSRYLYPQQVLRFTVIWEIAEVLGCRPGLQQFLQGLIKWDRLNWYYCDSHEPLQKQNKNVKRGYCNET